MTGPDYRQAQAALRMELRGLNVDIQRLRQEQHFFKRMGFGSDLQDMEMAELLERKRACEERIRHLELRAQRRVAGKASALSSLVVWPLLLVMGIQSLLTGRVQTVSGAR